MLQSMGSQRVGHNLAAGSAGKESACNVGDLALIPGLGRSPAEENRYPLQYSGLENSMGQQIGSELGKEYVKAVYCHPTYLTYM